MIKETKPVVIDTKTTYYVPSNLEFIRKVRISVPVRNTTFDRLAPVLMEQ